MRASTRSPTIKVPDVLDDPHPLVRKTLRAFTKKAWRKRKYAVSSSEPMRPLSENEHLDISVGKSSLDRALRIMDVLIKALEAKGYSVTVGKEKAPESDWRAAPNLPPRFVTHAHVKEWPLAIRVSEGFRREENPAKKDWYDPPHLFHDAGLLKFEILDHFYEEGIRRTWRDGKAQRLDVMLDDIVEGLEKMADAARRWDEARRLEKEERKRRERAAAEEAKRCAQEKKRRRKLLREARRWQLTRQVRGYLADLRSVVEELCGPIEPDTNNAQWFSWAENFVNEGDPLRQHEDILQEKIAQLAAARATSVPQQSTQDTTVQTAAHMRVCDCCARLCYRFHAADHHCFGYAWESNTDALMTVPEIAKKLHACDASVYKMVADGLVKHLRVAGKILVLRSDFEAFVGSGRATPTKTA